MSYRVLVCGGRDYRKNHLVWAALDALGNQHPDGITVIEGGASGADAAAALWADDYAIGHEQYRADWKHWGRRAGPMRNRRMLLEGRPDLVLAFPGGKGTLNMREQAQATGIPVYDGERYAQFGVMH